MDINTNYNISLTNQPLYNAQKNNVVSEEQREIMTNTQEEKAGNDLINSVNKNQGIGNNFNILV